MSLYLILRFLHIASAIMFVGGIFARQAVRSIVSRQAEIVSIVALTDAAGKVERLMVIPGSILVTLFGFVLAVLIRAPVFGALERAQPNWLLASIVIMTILAALVPLVFLPRGKIFEAALGDAVAKGQVTPQLQEQLTDRVVRRAHLAEMIGVSVILLLMIFKPF